MTTPFVIASNEMKWSDEAIQGFEYMSKLELQNITVAVEGKELVHDVSLSLQSSTVSVLMGKNGSGKSTLANAVMGHPSYTLTSGSVFLDGEEITSYPPNKKAEKGLFLSQQHTPKIGGVSLATFLQKAYESVHCREVPALEFYLDQKKTAESLGLDTTLLDRPLTAELSGGERKQSEVLQLAVLQPKYALLDEVDSGVDVTALKTVFRAVAALAKKGMGVLLISHHPSLRDHLTPHAVFVMEEGRLTQSGSRQHATDILTGGLPS